MHKKLTEKEFQKKLEELKQLIRQSVDAFPDDEKLKAKRLKKAEKDPLEFGKIYLPHYTTKPYGKFHHEIIKHCEQRNKSIVGIAGPREHGKTIVPGHIYILHQLLFKQRKFIIIVSETQDLAMERLLYIKAELEENPRIKQDFGDFKGRVWTDDDIRLKNGIRVLALGYKMPIRGKLNGPHRPDFLLIDDFESAQSARNERIARQKLAYVKEEAWGAISRDATLVWLGNIPAPKCAMQLYLDEAEENKSLVGIKYKMVQDDGSLLWAENYTMKDVKRIKDVVGEIAFQREYQMNPVIEGNIFKSEWFRYFETPENPIQSKVIYIDPSLGAKKTSDYKAIIVLGFDGKYYYIIDCFIRKMSVNAMVKLCYEIDNLYPDAQWAMEDNFWQSILFEDFNRAAEEYGYHIPIRGITNKINKELRIEKLSPLIERGIIKFKKEYSEDQKLLIEQLLFYPGHTNDDAPDALAGALDMIKVYSGKNTYKSLGKRTFQVERIRW